MCLCGHFCTSVLVTFIFIYVFLLHFMGVKGFICVYTVYIYILPSFMHACVHAKHAYLYIDSIFLHTFSSLKNVQRGLCVCFCMCAHVCSPADFLICVCVTHDKLTLQSSPVDVQGGGGGGKDNYRYCHGNCRPAVRCDTHCSVCVCVSEWGPLFLVGVGCSFPEV